MARHLFSFSSIQHPRLASCSPHFDIDTDQLPQYTTDQESMRSLAVAASTHQIWQFTRESGSNTCSGAITSWAGLLSFLFLITLTFIIILACIKATWQIAAITGIVYTSFVICFVIWTCPNNYFACSHRTPSSNVFATI
jgi:hypothetical protein